MHLLAGETLRIDDGETAVDLGQSPGDMIFLSAADSELALFTGAAARRPAGAPSLRLANLMRLGHPMSTDLYLERTAAHARLVVVRLIGGAGYWSYGLERLRELARGGGPPLAVVPGESRWDTGLEAFSTVSAEHCRQLWRYLVAGGGDNADRALAFMAHLIDAGPRPPAAISIASAGCYWPGEGVVDLEVLAGRVAAASAVAPVVFYRSLVEGGQTAPIEALVDRLAQDGILGLPLFVASLKDRESQTFLAHALSLRRPDVVLNTTAFAASRIGAVTGTVLDGPDRPVLQVILAGSSEEAWRDSPRGLLPRDLTMNVVLPEIDGRLTTRAISFKAEMPDRATDSLTTRYRPRTDRVDFVARQAYAWVRVGRTHPRDRRIALILSNYPGRDGRIANGVGLDTPESVMRIARALADSGYDVAGFPDRAAAMMALLLAGETNAPDRAGRRHATVMSISAYRRFFSALPPALRTAVTARWGPPEADRFAGKDGFRLAVHRFGNIAVGIQPSRGYDLDPKASYHDPDLVPPHRYLATYAWLREVFAADAVVHVGKHGNLEWLPGKALALSETCWPEATLGSTPLVYPFIVNDPGEGSQAKRRNSAVVVDHLVPPLTRAEIHGGLAELETLIDEYYLAAGVDPRRRAHLETEILSSAERHGLDRDLGIGRQDPGGALQALDAHLCELKEMQIRDGLHVLGASPSGVQRRDTLRAIARVPRGSAPADQSLQRAIAEDLGLGFDPLDCAPGAAWEGPRPEILAKACAGAWRTVGDTVERIEALAARLIEGAEAGVLTGLPVTRAVFDWIVRDLAPALDASGHAEVAAVLAALDGRFVAPGPSGAPTRGRADVLPTGRNFYSVDVRGVPTAAAWTIGRAAADALALRYLQDEGEWPRTVALSAWGTSNMRTGGDDVAEVLALIGAAPEWEAGTGRVTGFRVLSLAELGRPRVDVTLRISGMFRDAFPAQIDLIDSAVRAVAALDEDDETNPIAAETRKMRGVLGAAGMPPDRIERYASARIFGAKPGAYGAGLQALIDSGGWGSRADFAEAFLAWGGFAYGRGEDGSAAPEVLAERLRRVEAVAHNQDNREHDILDSDDYYQFQGGLAATVETLRGASPRVYHGDHARPEKPVVRPLGEEIARVVRGRAANPKWIAGVMRHGYKGAFEIAATVDYLFAYAATTRAVADHHFDQLYDAYVADDVVRDFMAKHNRPALAETAARLREAIDRGLWSPRSNSAYDRLSTLADSESGGLHAP